jgi:hypothetical protein
MENYRKKIKKRLTLLSMVCCASLPIYFVLCYLTKNESPFAQGLIIGVLSSIEICSVVGFFKTYRLMHNEEWLKKAYIEENDERNKEIQKETACKSNMITTYGIGLAAVIAGFYDIKICITLTAVLSFNLFVIMLVNVYFRKKM